MRKRFLALAFLPFIPAFAQAVPEDVVLVETQVFFAEAQPGGANEGTCFVANTTEGDIRVRLRAAVVYADGSTSRLTGNFDPGPVQAGGAFELSIFFVIEPDRPLGPAAFTCEVQAQSTDLRGKPETEASSAPFVLVPATTAGGTPTP